MASRKEPLPYFHALAVFACKGNRLYRVDVRPDEPVCIWAGSGMEGVAGARAAGVQHGLVGALIAKALDPGKKNAARQAVLDKPAPADARRLFDAGLGYCQGGGDLPIRFRGLQAGGMIVPCLVSPSVDATVVEFARTIPGKHWASSNFPCSTTCPRARRTIAGRRGSGGDRSTPIFTR